MTDYKIVGNKYYVYPNTELEESFMNGTASFPDEKELYVQMGPAYDAVKSEYTDDVAHIHNYDYYLVCVRKPEWVPDSPTPPQPTYKAIIINDSYGLEYVLEYTNGTEVNPSAVEVGRNVVFSTNNTSYTQTFPEGLEVEEYGVLPSGAVGYKFRMPDYDVEITITEAQPQPSYYDITVVDEYSTTHEIKNPSWETITGEDVEAGSQLFFVLRSFDYEPSFDPALEVVKEPLPNGTGYSYGFTMPQSDVTITIVEIPPVTLTVVNQDSRNINWYDGTNWYNDTQTVHVGTNIDFICWSTSDKITFSSPIEYTEEFDSEGRYQYHFTLNSDLTVTTGARTEAGIYYDGNTDINIQVGETPTYPTLENPNNVSPITYSSSNTGLATVDSSGNVTLVPNVTGEAYITATFEGDSTYDFSGTHFHINVRDGYNVKFITNETTMKFYNITKQEYIDPKSNVVRPNDEIFVTIVTSSGSRVADYKDSSNTWTTLSWDNFDPITVDGIQLTGGKFTMPSNVNNNDYVVIHFSSNPLRNITKNFQGNLYNEQIGDWWYDEEDQTNPGTYVTKYPESYQLGIESREGQTYTIEPTVTQKQGGSVGMYVTLYHDTTITKTN